MDGDTFYRWRTTADRRAKRLGITDDMVRAEIARQLGMETAQRLIDGLPTCHEDDCANLARPGLALCEEHDAAMFAPEPLRTLDMDAALRRAAQEKARVARQRVRARQVRAIFGPQGVLSRVNEWIDANPVLVMFYVVVGCGFAYSIFALVHQP